MQNIGFLQYSIFPLKVVLCQSHNIFHMCIFIGCYSYWDCGNQIKTGMKLTNKNHSFENVIIWLVWNHFLWKTDVLWKTHVFNHVLSGKFKNLVFMFLVYFSGL